jgi:hypothetical protein
MLKLLWTYTKFLTARPIEDTYGVIETRTMAGLVDPRDGDIVGESSGKTLNERRKRARRERESRFRKVWFLAI